MTLPKNASDKNPAHAAKQSASGEQSRVAQAYQQISEMIFKQQLVGGDVLVEARLADQLGVSRTPLREALHRLEGEGLVTKGNGRNHVVRRVDDREYIQSLRLRLLIEPEATANATRAIPDSRLDEVMQEILTLRDTAEYHTEAHWFSDDSLHNMVIDCCGNDVMARVLRNLRAATRLYEIAELRDRLGPDCSEHLQILQALKNRDSAAARQAMEDHINSLIQFTRASFPG